MKIRTNMTGLTGNRPPSAGFTLIEVMVTLGIVVLVAGVVAASLYSGLSVWDTAADFDRRRMEALLTLETMEREIRSAVPFYAIPFSGQAGGMKFCAILGGKTFPEMPGKIEEIAYRFDEDSKTLSRLSRTFPWAGMTSPDTGIALRDVLEFRMYYADRVDDESSDLKWSGRWEPHGERLPAAVTIELVLAEKGGETAKISRTLYLPRRAGKEEGKSDDKA